MNIQEDIATLDLTSGADKLGLVDQLTAIADKYGYTVVDRNDTKPWGAYLRLDSVSTEQFIDSFFPGLTLIEAQLGVEGAELSPKFLLVAPGQRLSWQKHDRRAERWAFITNGAYYKSPTDEQGEVTSVSAGDVVQFARGERHRLVGLKIHMCLWRKSGNTVTLLTFRTKMTLSAYKTTTTDRVQPTEFGLWICSTIFFGRNG